MESYILPEGDPRAPRHPVSVRARRTQTHIESTSSLAMKLTWPRIETPTHYILVGFDEDLNKAFVNAVAETVDFLVAHKGLERSEAYSLAAVAADCRVSQFVDVRKGVHCMVPKSIFVAAAR
jgi:acetamidase/formamidase